jgi:uncharacterized protein YbjT (DUF2867 family)
MYATTGISGQIGSVIGRTVLDARQPVRAVLLDGNKRKAWTERGCEVALATIEDGASLVATFRGSEAVFVLVPPNLDPQPGFPEARAIGKVLRSALETARPGRVVYLSTIGARTSRHNLLNQHSIIEQALKDLPIPITFLRPAWFIENFRVGCGPRARAGGNFVLPATTPQATSDGGNRGCR